MLGKAANTSDEAEQIITRFLGKNKINLSLEYVKVKTQKDWFETSVQNNTLHIRATSPVAMCRGFYDYIKNQGWGINSWSGERLEIPKDLPQQNRKKTESLFKHHFYLNVVTYGYTMPYWDWKRWEKEIDWMALHGIDMPLALVGQEAIMRRVWKKLGLTDTEIANYFVGPAHLPWMRMGNISQIDGPLPNDWHTDQIELQHKILKRMRSLGMKPICPGFAGFIPPAIKRLFPKVKITKTSWGGGSFHNWMLSPKEDLFHEMGKLFIQEWEKEFGENQYYLVDSFNEMDIPFPPKDDPKRYSMLADYGNSVYSSIKAGNPNAVWVMQGWMFGYQRHIWDEKTLGALVSKVPNEKLLLLDLAADYNKHFWKNGMNWDFYKGFFNKPWIYSVIPNMGGKTALTGILSFYANGHLEALASKNKGQLEGFGMAPEGIENNEVIYELLSDAGWSNKRINLNEWLKQYSINRYGSCPEEITTFWNLLLQSDYGSFTDHPRYNWQFRPRNVKIGTVNLNPQFYKAIESFASASRKLKNKELYRKDLALFSSLYLGGKAEEYAQKAMNLYDKKAYKEATPYANKFIHLLTSMDRILTTHPNLQLKQWIKEAKSHGLTSQQQKQYIRNAKRIVTIWGPPVDDYSARIWSGLIRDYYVPRWKHYFESKGKKINFEKWELNWVKNSNLSPQNPPKNLIPFILEEMDKAK